MKKTELAKRLLKIAKELVKKQEKFNVLTASRRKLAYKLTKDPEKAKKLMKENGIELGYDGAVYRYPFTDFGVIDYRAKSKRNKSISNAVSQSKHMLDSVRNEQGKYTELLDELVDFRKDVIEENEGDTTSDEAIDDALGRFDRDIKPYMTRVLKGRTTESKKDIMESLADMRDSIEEGDFRSAMQDYEDATEACERYVEREERVEEGMKKQRKLMLNIENVLNKKPAYLIELATIGTPPSDKYDEKDFETVLVDSSDNLENEFKKMIKDKSQMAVFDYVKEDGKERTVRIVPEEIFKGKYGLGVEAWDFDRKNKQQYYFQRIQ